MEELPNRLDFCALLRATSSLTKAGCGSTTQICVFFSRTTASTSWTTLDCRQHTSRAELHCGSTVGRCLLTITNNKKMVVAVSRDIDAPATVASVRSLSVVPQC